MVKNNGNPVLEARNVSMTFNAGTERESPTAHREAETAKAHRG